MTPEPEFLTLAEVLEMHRIQLERWKGLAGIRDHGALESAVAQPAVWIDGDFVHGDLFTMAAAYAFHIAEAQAFVDGNKRTGLDAALTFLALNGVIIADPEMALFDAMIDIGKRRLTKTGFAKLLREIANVG